ncbi:hypothetical protein C8Q72DRAFT_783112 [Fomitopsis betulina]|nr:hypothetical protein C8Q72DRAFT_783112 [Fomitopsis betulina]
MSSRHRRNTDDTGQEDSAFAALPVHLQHTIDHVFDKARNSSVNPPRKRRKLDVEKASGSSIAPGGFVVDNSQPGGFLLEDDVEPGGFIVEDEGPEDMDNTSENADVSGGDKMPLSQIPHALQLLDLQPDDEDVLGIFRHAASGWQDRSRSTAHSDHLNEQYVSRKDWRAVCAALLDTDVGDEDDPPQSIVSHAFREGGDLTPQESSDSGDEYQGSEPEAESSEAGDDASDEDYKEGGFIVSKPKGKKDAPSTPTRLRARSSRKAARSLSNSDSEDDDNPRPRPLTARQRLESRRAFALIFPDIPDAQLDTQRIMIKDITRVAKLLKEKIAADEIMEMLAMFSTSADKSMSLQDFERMMLSAKLA